jgi:hypothetical protein
LNALTSATHARANAAISEALRPTTMLVLWLVLLDHLGVLRRAYRAHPPQVRQKRELLVEAFPANCPLEDMAGDSYSLQFQTGSFVAGAPEAGSASPTQPRRNKEETL